MNKKKNNQKLPDFFKPLFWSVDFNSLDLDKNKKTIILSVINYGDLKHWRFLSDYYGKNELKKILERLPATEFKPRAARLAEVLFKFKLNYAPRGVDQRRFKATAEA